MHFLSKRRKNQLIRSRIQFYNFNNVKNTCALRNETLASNVENNVNTSTSRAYM